LDRFDLTVHIAELAATLYAAYIVPVLAVFFVE